MPTVTGLTADKIFELDSVAVVGGAIQSNGTLVLETRGVLSTTWGQFEMLE